MNEQTQNNSVAVTAPVAPVAPVMPALVHVARGKGTVAVQGFSGSGSASQIKAALKKADPKLSAKALAVKVNEVLRGEKTLREQLSVAFHQALMQDGFIASHGEISKASAVIKFRRAPEPVKAVVKPETKEELEKAISELNEKLAKLGALNA